VVNLKQAPEAIAEKRIVDVDDDVEQGRAALPLLVPPQEAIDLLPEKLSVLFVDDDRILRKLATRSLAKVRPGWTVREAASGETALHLLENESFDLIFMDQYMTSVEQALKGTETIRALRSKGVDIAVCGLSANDLESAFLSAGANAFILKPFPCKNEELKHELTRVLADHATGTTKTMNSSSDSLSTSSQDLNLVNAH
jgi:CheY-like chemotaxis protein